MKKITIALMIWLSSFSAQAFSIEDMIALIQEASIPDWLAKNDFMFNTGFNAEFGNFEVAMNNIYQSNSGKGLKFNQSGSYLTMYNGILKYLIENKNNPDELYSLFIAVLYWENPKTREIFIPKTGGWGLKYIERNKEPRYYPFMAVSEFLLMSLLDGKDLSYDYTTKDSFKHIGEKRTVKPAELKNITPIFYTRNKFELIAALCSGSDSEIKKEINTFKNKYRNLLEQYGYTGSSITFSRGYLYSVGLGVKQDYKKAIDYYKKACDMGDTGACNNYGGMFYDGEGVEQNYTKAVELYKKACDMGSETACSNLGARFYHGEGVEQNYTKAAELFKKACDMGYSLSCENLEYMQRQNN